MTLDTMIKRAQNNVNNYMKFLTDAAKDGRIEASIEYAEKLKGYYIELMTLQFAKMEIEAPTD